MSVFVSHPGLQHSHQLAWALFECDLLQAFWSGVPVLTKGEKIPSWFPQNFVCKLKQVPIPHEYRRHHIIFPALLSMGNGLPWMLGGEDYMHKLCHGYDWWVSRHIAKLKPKVVVAYENSAYYTFQAAKAIGARCVLDAASLHYSVGREFCADSRTTYSNEIDRRKDLEIHMADIILTCSPLAQESYLLAGVAANKLRPMLLGADLPDGVDGWEPHKRPLRFIFAGALRNLKSIDVILSVFRRLHREQIDADIVLVGGTTEIRWLNEIEQTANAYYHPGVPQTELFRLFSQADCLLLPSRFDSFGMVVAEAMACGTPAIVSSRTGAKAIIEQFPGSGWIVEPDADSLYRCIRERIDNRSELFAARSHALEAAGHFTWQAYRQRVGRVFQEFIVQ